MKIPDSRSLHVKQNDEPQVDNDRCLYFWRFGWNSCREAMLAAAPTPPASDYGGCGNGECNWHGPIEECRMLGSIGPLCPECGETVEPDFTPPAQEGALHERNALAEAIVNAVIKAGIVRADAELTGPHLIMLCDDLVRQLTQPGQEDK